MQKNNAGGAEDLDTLLTMRRLATVVSNSGKPAEADPTFRNTLRGQEAKLGKGHPTVLRTLYEFAACLKAEGKTDEARTKINRAVDTARRVLGADHPYTKKYEKRAMEIRT